MQKPTRRTLLKTGAAAGLMAAANSPSAQGKEAPVNLLFIMTDQQRWDALSCAGSTHVDTPNLDRLAAEGVRFPNAVCASPVCAACRTSVLTGEPIHLHEVYDNPQAGSDHCREGLRSFDAYLHDAGYWTECRGRWHAPPRLLAYDGEKPMINQIGKFYKQYIERVLPEAPKPKDGQIVYSWTGWPYTPDIIDYDRRSSTTDWDVKEKRAGRMYGRDTIPAEHTLSAMVANETIEALHRIKGSGEPFALTSSYLHPHHPLIVAEPYIDMVKPEDMVPAESLHDSQENGICGDWYPWFLDEFEKEHAGIMMARYYATVKELDDHIGRVLDTLDELDLAKNTLVIFTSDHGEMLGAHGMHQKFVPYRESMGVPLILRLPGQIPAGHVVDTPVCIQDLYATILDYTDTPGPERHSHSLRPLIEGKASPHHGTVVVQFNKWWILVQTAGWKYVWSKRPDDVDLLFDLEADPLERNNLVGKNPDREKHLAHAREMRAKLVEWLEATDHEWLAEVRDGEVA